MASSRSLGVLTLDLVAKIGGFTGPLDQAGRIADKRMREIEKRAKQFGQALGLAFTAAATAVAVGVKAAIDNADALNDLNVRLGISAEKLSGWAYAAKQSGTDIDALGIGLKKLAKNMADALDPKSSQAALFKALDVKPLDAATGKLKTLEQILPEISDKFAQLHDDTLEAALAQQLFGKSGADLLEFLNLGSQGLDDMQSKLRELGGELSQSTLSAADQFNDKLGDLKTATDGLFTTLAADLLPHLDEMVSSMIDATKEGSELREIVSGLVTVFEYLSDVCRDVDNLWRGLVSTGIALYNVADNLSKLNPSSALARWLAGGDTWADNWREAKTAAEQAGEAFDKFGMNYHAGGSNPRPSIQLPAGFDPGWMNGNNSALEKRLQAALGGSGGGGGKTGKSDAERQAEQLEQAYERMKAQMAETIALFGQEGQAAKVRYDLEFGELAKLSGPKKQELLDLAKKQDLQKAEAEETARLHKLEEDRLETVKHAHEELSQTLDDMQFEIDLMGKSNAERTAEIELRRIGAGLSANERAAAKEAIAAKADQLESLREQVAALDDFRQSFEDTVFDVATGTKSIADAFRSLADELIQQLIRIAAHQLTESLLGPFGGTSTGSGGGWLSSLFGIFTGSSSSSSSQGLFDSFNSLGITGHFASGTDFAPGGMAWVGEQGPELVNLPRGAQVIPHSESMARAGAGFSQVNNFNFRNPERKKTQQQIAAETNTAGRLAQARRGVTA
jgi:hypothetical protein